MQFRNHLLADAAEWVVERAHATGERRPKAAAMEVSRPIVGPNIIVEFRIGLSVAVRAVSIFGCWQAIGRVGEHQFPLDGLRIGVSRDVRLRRFAAREVPLCPLWRRFQRISADTVRQNETPDVIRGFEASDRFRPVYLQDSSGGLDLDLLRGLLSLRLFGQCHSQHALLEVCFDLVWVNTLRNIEAAFERAKVTLL